MALYKITSSLTTQIDFADKSVGVPSTSELTDEEAAIASKVADLVQVDKEFATGGKIEKIEVDLHPQETIVPNKANNDVEEATPKLNFK